MAIERLRRFAQSLRPGRSKAMTPWRTPVTLDRGSIGEACMALDGHGLGAALWESSGRLWTMPIGPQSAPALVRLPLGAGTTPRILLNPEGRGLALWQALAGEERQLLGKILGGGEGESHVLFRTAGLVYHLQAAVDRRGNALVVWLLETDGRYEVMAQSFDTRGQVWEQAPTILGIPNAAMVEPRLAVNHREHAMVLWEVEGSGQEGLVASHYWPSDRIWSDRPVSVVSHATRHHQVVMDNLGNALALWIHAPRGQRSSLEASYYDGQRCEWGAPEVLSTAQTFTHPRLVMNGEGEALAAWCQAEGHGASRLISKAFARGNWETGVECLELGHAPVREFSVDLGPEGQAGLIAVHHGTNGDWVSARLRHGSWGEAFTLAPASAQLCALPQIRLCPQGASAIWVQGTGREGNLMLVETW
ncbi:MAG: hypothetical protein HXX12_01715 [Geothrix sp.]|uniref:hypothetical protein n=1 Tax=Geothrix sp. TaxID=1962974 RepID=UPI00182C2665|nr:hypothetical protein [Geothrix sp.]NWJ39670.1 hypothetical protein [Geothrix sp.]WIL22310.1 MAG: hypothetical protein QOZ81_001609 [Geothrix sp.]